ncbi:diphthamide biosynthesis protein 3-like [Ochotona princeps]|uniref:diphthamide biosynthesis protein 3-like n=1 Tax=Ochotona princeps TaxID=9978 RepID=UPI002714A7B5|nr:diphthamide biosynthesis protein 3-like [Ochotona princeps]
MAVFYNKVDIKVFQYYEGSVTYFYPCPCGDNFSIIKDQFLCGKTVPAPSSIQELVTC